VQNTQANIDVTVVQNLQPEVDLNMHLPGLDGFLAQVASRQRNASSSTFYPTSKYPVFHPAQLPSSLVGPEEYTHFRLAAFEKWVEYHLSNWIEDHLYDANACEKLRTLMINYYGLASGVYAGAPTGLSIMYLALAELWIACDKCACSIYPMLVQYDPEVRLTEFQCLVLPQKSQLVRLNAVECYVKSRQNSAKKGLPSVYRKFGDPLSFAVRHFDQSEALQTTLRAIEVDAAAKRTQKCEELRGLKSRHKQHMDRYNTTECQTQTVVVNHYHGYTEEQHRPGCSRCAEKDAANSLTIRIYEWPVSSTLSVAKATVFELVIPEPYSYWRDASAYFISTVLEAEAANDKPPECSYMLDSHKDLSHMLSLRCAQRRIVPLSETKAHSVTHRKHKKAIPHLDDEDVCLRNALRYAYFDTSRNRFTMDMPTPTDAIPKKCMYRMPQRSKALEKFMYHPPSSPDGPPANEVIVSQAFQ
jgi:hypothetical protein